MFGKATFIYFVALFLGYMTLLASSSPVPFVLPKQDISASYQHDGIIAREPELPIFVKRERYSVPNYAYESAQIDTEESREVKAEDLDNVPREEDLEERICRFGCI
ncbi:hypothetical protein SERLA73DRAFT_191894 [Serpula lacrymans var. lacrymans S7.3]|uniref:Uncharacterized protein n=2 Tax=Serpula lacrymans var. lacrymans TaxID=341189 RepID=F8QIJ2_SERL3|nr:uncharacterized protein SERLADRAFT_463186 [Serpula lacrymans var. lacrymans S7.9]EGN91874.1 hypothetical protein SERLA73DRAFT_191894 [Serpula lacrymans var. lacrymans S7.3]EGO26291.1 hypothetical protein SERLADRAFT_463186 [Serpula lacrymans var. lacrymans S7.9]